MSTWFKHSYRITWDRNRRLYGRPVGLVLIVLYKAVWGIAEPADRGRAFRYLSAPLPVGIHDTVFIVHYY